MNSLVQLLGSDAVSDGQPAGFNPEMRSGKIMTLRPGSSDELCNSKFDFQTLMNHVKEDTRYSHHAATYCISHIYKNIPNIQLI